MNSDNDKKAPDAAPTDKTDAADGAIVDEGWAQVDLHDRKDTPKADLPSDIELRR